MIECVANVSEGRRLEVVDRLTSVLRSTAGLRLLDYSADRSHNRSVFTFVGEPAVLEAGVLAFADRVIEGIDLRIHRGEHPRIGALDVVPFIPLDNATMIQCVDLAQRVGRALADRFNLPVYLYEEAATSAARKHLENIRRGQFEDLARKMQLPEWTPDFGPSRPHPTAGATAVGARRPLIAFNVNLATDDLEAARQISRAVRASGKGGLPAVKAMAVSLSDRGIVQVSMNLTDFTQTPVAAAFERVAVEAAKRGVETLESEIIGLVPARAVANTTEAKLKLRGNILDRTLEHRLAADQRT